MYHRLHLAAVALMLSLAAHPALAKVSAAEASKLGQDLTPVGAEKAGNKDGTIPAWTPAQQKGTPTEFASNPQIEAEKPLFTITKANMAQYADKLDAGHRKLLQTYDSYKMNIYPSHRIETFPDAVLKATVANAGTAELQGTDTISNAKLGLPFPIPKSGAEAIWNHRLKWRGESVTRYNNQMIVQPDGSAQLTKIVEDVKFFYASLINPVTANGHALAIKYASQTVSPPRVAGTYILVHEYVDTRDAWIYSPGLKRIRRAPTVCCDNPYEGTDGMQFYDQVDMFNGTLERYDWKLVGKKEMYVPYDSYKIASRSTKYADMAKPRHLNQDLARYELHRVWVVDATLRQGTNHTFKRRLMYLDEDGWTILGVEDYDSRDQLYQYQEGHNIFAANLLTNGNVPEVIYHFDSGRYFLTGMFNEDKPLDFTRNFNDEYFTAEAVQKRTTK